MDIVNVLRTKIQADMNKATWEVNRILANPLADGALESFEEWTSVYTVANAKLDMLDRLKGQMDSDQKINKMKDDENKT
jgi:hypothetical protein